MSAGRAGARDPMSTCPGVPDTPTWAPATELSPGSTLVSPAPDGLRYSPTRSSQARLRPTPAGAGRREPLAKGAQSQPPGQSQCSPQPGLWPKRPTEARERPRQMARTGPCPGVQGWGGGAGQAHKLPDRRRKAQSPRSSPRSESPEPRAEAGWADPRAPSPSAPARAGARASAQSLGRRPTSVGNPGQLTN